MKKEDRITLHFLKLTKISYIEELLIKLLILKIGLKAKFSKPI
jgi:hypothetical protein